MKSEFDEFSGDIGSRASVAAKEEDRALSKLAGIQMKDGFIDAGLDDIPEAGLTIEEYADFLRQRKEAAASLVAIRRHGGRIVISSHCPPDVLDAAEIPIRKFSQFHPRARDLIGSMGLGLRITRGLLEEPPRKRLGLLSKNVSLIKERVAAIAHEPSYRAQSLLKKLETATEPAPFETEFCYDDEVSPIDELPALAAAHADVRELLWSRVRQSGPRAQGIALDILAGCDWPKVSAYLAKAVTRWNARGERHLLLAAMRLMRRNKIETGQAAALEKGIRKFLLDLPSGAREGTAPLQTELLVDSLLTFGTFSSDCDLELASHFWQPGSDFDVALTATETGARIAARYAPSPAVDAFFQAARDEMKERLFDLFRVRSLALNNGAMLWAHAELLLARLGPESAAVAGLGRQEPALAPRLLRKSKEAEETLLRIGHRDWVEKQRSHIDAVRTALQKAADANK